MTKQYQSFHPGLIISNHFDEIINQIDIKNETLLANQLLPDETREKQIEKIKEIKRLNLSHLTKKLNEDEFKEKWSHVMDDESLEYKQKIDKSNRN